VLETFLKDATETIQHLLHLEYFQSFVFPSKQHFPLGQHFSQPLNYCIPTHKRSYGAHCITLQEDEALKLF